VPKLKLLLVGCGVVALVAGALALTRTTTEPSFKQVPLSEWLTRSYRHRGTNEAAVAEATHAIREIGTNALPYLLEGVRFQPSSWKSNAYNTIKRFPKTLQPAFLATWLTESRNKTKARQSGQLIWILAEKAIPAAPELLRLSYSTRPDVSSRALATFADMGTNGHRCLIKAAGDTSHPDRLTAIQQMGYVLRDLPDSPEILRGLIELTSDPDLMVRRNSAIIIMTWINYQTGGDLQKMRAHPIVLTNREVAFVCAGYEEPGSDPPWIRKAR
jgi:hypothetical protein